MYPLLGSRSYATAMQDPMGCHDAKKKKGSSVPKHYFSWSREEGNVQLQITRL